MGWLWCPGPLSLPNEWGTVLEGGTSTVAGFRAGGDLVRRELSRVGTVLLLGRGWLGTLLGPEGTAGRLFVQGRYGSCVHLRVGVWPGWLRVGTAQTNHS